MQMPPGRRSPPVLFTRPANEWINKVNQRHKELAELALSSEQKESLDRWAEAEFIHATLKLDGINASRDSVMRIISSSSTPASVTDESSFVIADLSSAVRAVESAARADGREARLTPELLIRLHTSPGKAKGFRETSGDTSRRLKPVPAEHLCAAIESACLWFTAESFAELNPIEQAAIVYFRMIEIQPFEQANERAALIAASLFTLRSGLPLIIIKPELDRAFRAALDEGAQMNTRPMVELIAEAVEQTLTEMIQKQRGKVEKRKR